jgi:hypothetical protein
VEQKGTRKHGGRNLGTSFFNMYATEVGKKGGKEEFKDVKKGR